MEIINNLIENFNTIKKINDAVGLSRTLEISGASVGEKAVIASGILGKIAIVVSDPILMQQYEECFFSLGEKVSTFYGDLNVPVFSFFKDKSFKENNICNLYDFAFGNSRILLIFSDALLNKYNFKLNKDSIIDFEISKDYNPTSITQKLINMGYKKCQKIEKVGDFAVRGDIIDLFAPNFENPIRLDFFGDTLEKMYFFDISEMQKIEDIASCNIYPNKLIFSNDQIENQIEKNLKSALESSTLQGDALIKSSQKVGEVINGIKEGLISLDEEFLTPFFENQFSIIDLISEFSKIVVDEPKKLIDSLEGEYKSVMSDIYDYVTSGELLPNHTQYFFDTKKAISFLPSIIFSSYNQETYKCDYHFNIRTIGSRNYTFDFKALIRDLNIYYNSKYKVVLFAGSDDAKNSVSEYLIKNGIMPSDNINFISQKPQVVVSSYNYPKSFSFLDNSFIAIGTDDLIKKNKSEVKNITSKNKKRKVFYLPKVGDYVVHEFHGIGKCVELTKLNLNGNEKEYFVIEYEGGDKLYLPSEQADLISAYLAGEAEPKLNKIGGAQFAKIKEKVKESVSKLAINLLELYSKREKTKGFVYSPDNDLIYQFENSFKFEETEDQISAILDIKKDMEGPKIMDRLICGDVGYGKTEVALRAAYKAIMSGKQVAFLCPTTILSQQHFKTASERFDGFGVNVAVINRFKTTSQKQQIIKDLKDGKIDLIIGTHSLLSKEIEFKNLGLLILDEEQRFGVADKEKIKSMKESIDVLTLSATPIPRTLNMALTGIRDISIIETPPKERIAVNTFVNEESDTLIQNACRRELERGGQVLYVYNRVEGIYNQAKRLRELLPNAKIGVAHGQMPERELEDTILKLYNGEFDILVATTLIESGIDLPLANTLIVIDSDRLGLSELYQLRGRIGRGSRLAYAYFTYNPSKLLTADAYRRLDAIMEFTSLGSGFKIAMRDLEIRGAGDVLGKQQHGHMEKVGYDLYCKLLNSAVSELKGEKVKEIKPIKIDIMCSASLPQEYISSEDERINLYSQISSIDKDEDYILIYNNLFETYGKPPIEAIRLLKIAFIKNLGVRLGLCRVLINAQKCELYLYKIPEIMANGLNKAMTKRSNAVLKFEELPIISFSLGMLDIDTKIDYILEFLKESYLFENQDK